MTGPATPGTPAAPVVPAALAVEDLRFAYTRAAEELFDGLTHAFTPGAVTALTGLAARVLPGYEAGFGWVLPALVGLGVGLACTAAGRRTGRGEPAAV